MNVLNYVWRNLCQTVRDVRWWFVNRITAFCRSWLLSHDRDYQLQEAQHALIRAREEARARGIGPLDPEYPNIFDFYKLPDLSALASPEYGLDPHLINEADRTRNDQPRR